MIYVMVVVVLGGAEEANGVCESLRLPPIKPKARDKT